ncbi:uncharacterized protein [Littorina saxatilis]|uniref:uncharacterized protein isoform X2 n=1 Tax=Littorina saxatilis TaxID=31220 RepID=UPI0038B41AE0
MPAISMTLTIHMYIQMYPFARVQRCACIFWKDLGSVSRQSHVCIAPDQTRTSKDRKYKKVLVKLPVSCCECQLIMNTKITLLIYTGLLASAQEKPSGLLITCEAPMVYEGGRGAVVCNYRTSVTEFQSVDLSVDHYQRGSNDPDEVASCTNVRGEGLKCQANKDGYTFMVAEKLDTMVLNIAETTVDHAGRYVCKLMSPEIERTQLQPCEFSVNESNKSKSEQRASDNTRTDITDPEVSTPSVTSDLKFLIGLPVGLTVLLVGIVIAVFFLRRRNHNREQPNVEDGQPDTDSTGSGTSDSLVKEKPSPYVSSDKKAITAAQGEREPLISDLENNAIQNKAEEGVHLQEDAKNSNTTNLDAFGEEVNSQVESTAAFDTKGPLDRHGSTENPRVKLAELKSTSGQTEAAGFTPFDQASQPVANPQHPATSDTFRNWKMKMKKKTSPRQTWQCLLIAQPLAWGTCG